MSPFPVKQSETDELLRDYRAASGPYCVQMPTGERLYVGMERDFSVVEGGVASRDEVLQSIQSSKADFARGDWIEGFEVVNQIRARYGL